MPTDPEMWVAIIATIAAAAAAVVAAVALNDNRKATRNSSTLDHIRYVIDQYRPLWRIEIEDAQADVLAYYRREVDDLSHDGCSYLAFMEAVDVLALAVERKIVDEEIALDYLDTLLDDRTVSSEFIRAAQTACDNEKVLCHVGRLLTKQLNL